MLLTYVQICITQALSWLLALDVEFRLCHPSELAGLQLTTRDMKGRIPPEVDEDLQSLVVLLYPNINCFPG